MIITFLNIWEILLLSGLNYSNRAHHKRLIILLGLIILKFSTSLGFLLSLFSFFISSFVKEKFQRWWMQFIKSSCYFFWFCSCYFKICIFTCMCFAQAKTMYTCTLSILFSFCSVVLRDQFLLLKSFSTHQHLYRELNLHLSVDRQVLVTQHWNRSSTVLWS